MTTQMKGLGVGLTAAVGTVHVVAPAQPLPAWGKSSIGAAAEMERLRGATAAVVADLDRLAAGADHTTAEIFEAMKMWLEDDGLLEIAEEHLNEGSDAAGAIGEAFNAFAVMFEGDAAFEERIADLQDLSRRVQAHLAGIHLGLDLPQTGHLVLVGEDFSPADTAQFTPAVVGVVTRSGGPTSHTAIICRARGIAAVVSVTDAGSLVDGQSVLVDPVGDRVVVDGAITDATKPLEFADTDAATIIPVRSNIGTAADAKTAAATKANGVGLFRTELLYLSASTQPSVEQQATSYAEVLAAAPEGPIVVRTIDAGSDKPVPFLNMPHEENPSLGVRGFRLIVEHRQFIADQLSSLEAARKSTGREVWVMAPMIATVDEAAEFAALARSIGDFKVGIMIETPAISMQVDRLSGVVDFVSIGTNDLSQYLFAADRMNPALGALLNPWQPGLIRMLAKIGTDGAAAGVSVGVCGESASDPAFAVVLAGLGITSVSASPSQVNVVSNALASVTMEQAKAVAAAALSGTDAATAKSAALAALATTR
jgi:phosphoenolpyruvate-protein phosphotransferase (PTS system enzyme I)